MPIEAPDILAILDRCCDAYTFPMLDNGYVYLAATRLSLYRGLEDWAIVIEVFGFSPRAGLPDTHIYTFSSSLCNRDTPATYMTVEAYKQHLANNPNNQSRFVEPIESGDWQDDEDDALVAKTSTGLILRGKKRPLPALEEYAQRDIALEDSERAQVFELCRFLANATRESVLATSQERSQNILPSMTQILQLEEWNHPDVVESEDRPSGSETFQQLAQVLSTGDTAFYRPTRPPNTHWRNWPDGGLL